MVSLTGNVSNDEFCTGGTLSNDLSHLGRNLTRELPDLGRQYCNASNAMDGKPDLLDYQKLTDSFMTRNEHDLMERQDSSFSDETIMNPCSASELNEKRCCEVGKNKKVYKTKEKNRIAARMSRRKKKEYVRILEERVANLEAGKQSTYVKT